MITASTARATTPMTGNTLPLDVAVGGAVLAGAVTPACGPGPDAANATT